MSAFERFKGVKHIMDCSICYEQFIQPTNNQTPKEFGKNHNDDYKWIRYCALLLLPNTKLRYMHRFQ